MARDTSPAYYKRLWDELAFLPAWKTRIATAARKVESGRAAYRGVESAIGIPWAVVGVVHYMECSCDFDRQVLNGERWDRKTTLVPKGKGPWDSWIDSALDGLDDFPPLRDIAGIGKALERHNGQGYIAKGKNSPYLVSGAQSGVNVGKYTSDGVYDPNAVSQQVGALCILRQLFNVGAWKPENGLDNAPPVPLPVAAGRTPEQNRIVQSMLNGLILTLPQDARPAVLNVDGVIGPKTRGVASRFGIEL